MLNAIWANTAGLPAFPSLDGELETDVLIIGGGMAGLLCAQALEQSHVPYALIEADTICGGVSRNTTAKITSQHGAVYEKLLREFDRRTARLYWEASEQALSRYRELAKDIDCDFESKDSFLYSTDGTPMLAQEMAALRSIGIPARFEKDLALPFPTDGGICFPNQAQFHPLKFAAGIAGNRNIYEHTAARSFAGNTVLTDKGRITARKIIVATHFPIFNNHGGFFLKLYQARSYVLALENAPDVKGMYLGLGNTGISLRNYGPLLLLGGGEHRTGKSGGGWEALEQFARQHFPASKVVCRWATQDCMTLDGIPYIGRYSGATPNLYVATGFSKWGMTGSMVAAMILSDLVQEKENPYAHVFTPQRSSLRPQLLKNGASAVMHLLTPTVPRCPHMGCALKWNPREHSWDCPCHGSRFRRDGKLLDGPATGNLRKL